MKNKHVHEWRWDGWWDTGPGSGESRHFVCEFPDCDETRSLVNAEASLNATERLSRALAYTLAMEDTMPEGSIGGDALMAYAASLENEDERN